jgi:hypothetical protein
MSRRRRRKKGANTTLAKGCLLLFVFLILVSLVMQFFQWLADHPAAIWIPGILLLAITALFYSLKLAEKSDWYKEGIRRKEETELRRRGFPFLDRAVYRSDWPDDTRHLALQLVLDGIVFDSSPNGVGGNTRSSPIDFVPTIDVVGDRIDIDIRGPASPLGWSWPRDRSTDSLHSEELAAHARQLVSRIFDAAPDIQIVCLSLFASLVHPTLGTSRYACVLSSIVERDIWQSIVHGNVTARNALSNFPLRIAYDAPAGAVEVQSFRSGTISDPPQTVSLSAVDPIEFEHLVADLLRAMGYLTVTVTGQSGDGGIDVVAVNPTPVVGGRIVVQCKRYQASIGAPVVRDLYGALTHEGANKGILITTSTFTTEARRFAEGKPLELIDGELLKRLLDQHRLVINSADGEPL